MLTIQKSQMDAMSAASGQPAVMPCGKTWVEIRLLDGQKDAVPDIQYRVQLPDASVREGKLDSNGCARFDGIVAGQCVVTFPELDEQSWWYDSSDAGGSK